ncbi:MAG: DNA polymerase/3'-5' exonuclease PolX [Chloroflexi bacterium]|nr:DNA polymerase/3'-5' exonuclease PolX [Chloroflexota bacterium]
MTNSDVARTLADIADLLELKGELVFKVRAYQRAARVIENLPVELELLLRDGKLRDVPGVGESIALKISELITTGRLQYYEELKKQFPEGISNLLAIPGIGPKSAMRFTRELGIRTVDELEKAIQEGKVAGLKRMGQKGADKILRAIQAMRRKDTRMPIGHAMPVVEKVIDGLKKCSGLKNITPAGSLRRFKETVGDLDLMGTADDARSVIECFVTLPQVIQVVAKGPTKATIITNEGYQIDLRLVEHGAFGSLLQYFTGSKQHNIALREKAHRRGLKLSEYSIADVETGKEELFATEEAFYSRLSMQYIPPEIREATQEIDLAEKHALPRLIETGDLKGDFHVHSKWSDGHDPIEQIAITARKMKYSYIAITDHSVGRGIARGLNVERVKEQQEEIRKIEEKVGGIRILHGAEVDIRADGALDFPDEVLAEFDVVVASVHSAMGQEKAQMTGRVIKAMKNPYVDIIAHATGRLIGEREPVSIDMEEIFRSALATGTAMEINAMPARLDLKDIHIQRARELGVKLVIGTDAHREDQLVFAKYGVAMARRGWCQAGDVLNTLPYGKMRKALKRNRR